MAAGGQAGRPATAAARAAHVAARRLGTIFGKVMTGKASKIKGNSIDLRIRYCVGHENVKRRPTTRFWEGNTMEHDENWAGR